MAYGLSTDIYIVHPYPSVYFGQYKLTTFYRCCLFYRCDKIPAAKRAKANKHASYRQSTLSWKIKTDVDMVSQTLKLLPAQEPGPQLRSVDSHSPLSLFKFFIFIIFFFFVRVHCQLCATTPMLRLPGLLQTAANINGEMSASAILLHWASILHGHGEGELHQGRLQGQSSLFSLQQLCQET